jgi:hypothetical protein
MKESTLRTLHRRIGAVAAIFVVVQAGSGLGLTIERLAGHAGFGVSGLLHTGGAAAGDILRAVAGLGMLFMAATGAWIYMKIIGRRKPAGVK